MRSKTRRQFLIEVGRRIAERRAQCNLQAQAVAEALGIDKATQSRREHGATFPVEDLCAYADLLRVPITELLPNGAYQPMERGNAKGKANSEG